VRDAPYDRCGGAAVLSCPCLFGSGDDRAPGGMGATGVPGGSGGTGPTDLKGPIISQPVAGTRMVRLNNQQWEKHGSGSPASTRAAGTVQGLRFSPLVTAFDTNGGVLTVDSNNRDDFQSAAESIARRSRTIRSS